METVLYITAETVRQIAILLQPFMPESAAKLLDLLAAFQPTSAISRRLEKPAVWKRERTCRQADAGLSALCRKEG
jgi:methionyl-tRNA synthetase